MTKMSATPKLIVIRGLPGTGKSTLAKKIAKEEGFLHLENDMYFETQDGYVYSRDRLPDAIRWFEEQALSALQSPRGLVVSNCFITKDSFDKLLRLQPNHLVVRMTHQYPGNLHNVPQERIEKMKADFQDYPGEILF